MQVQIHYQGLESSPWLDQLINRKMAKLERYLTPASTIQVHLKCEDKTYTTTIEVHNTTKSFAFTSDGLNLYESFSSSVEKAARALNEHKRQLKDKINKKYFSLKKDFAA